MITANCLLIATPAFAQQTVPCGSTGADGAFNPTVSTTLTLPPSGVFNFTTVNVPSDITVTFTKNAANTPVTILSTGDVTINGTIDVSGKSAGTSGIPGHGGPGGFDGGMGGNPTVAVNGTSGLGPGGGGGGDDTVGSAGSGGGFGTAGVGLRAGATYGVPTLIPLVGGSGGGGAQTSGGITAGGGGGGGGAILICTPGTLTLTTTGSIRANGGVPELGDGGGGSGGGIRLIANRITGSGTTIQSVGGLSRFIFPSGGLGRIRLEAFETTVTGAITPAPSGGLPGPVTLPAGSPTLQITSVGGVTPPANPQGSFLASPDIALSPTLTNPLTVNLTAANIPIGTFVAVTVTPEAGPRTTVNSTALSGTLAGSTASASVTLRNGVSIISATATFATSPTASLGAPMMIGEEEVKWIRVGAVYGGPSTLTYITASGKEVPAGQLTPLR